MDRSTMDKMATSMAAGLIYGSVCLEKIEKELQDLEKKTDFVERKISDLEEQLNTLTLEGESLSNQEKRLQKEITYYENKHDGQTKLRSKLSSNIRKYEIHGTCLQAFIKITTETIKEEDELGKLQKEQAQQKEQKQMQIERLEKLSALVDRHDLERKELIEKLKNTDLHLLLTGNTELQ